VRSDLQGAKAKVKRFAVIAEEREALLQSAAQAQVDWCGGPEQRVDPSTFIRKEVSAVVILAEKFYRLPQRRRILPKFAEAIFSGRHLPSMSQPNPHAECLLSQCADCAFHLF
jgi:hypothetical protein